LRLRELAIDFAPVKNALKLDQLGFAIDSQADPIIANSDFVVMGVAA